MNRMLWVAAMRPTSHVESEDYHITEAEAKTWVDKIERSDGHTGGKWTKEQTEQVRLANCPECDPMEFYITLNMAEADYLPTAQKYGMDKPEFYASLARDFLMDKDAKSGKLARYMREIPK